MFNVAYDVSADGSYVVGHSDSGLDQISESYEAFIWNAETGVMVGLGDLSGGATSSTATSI